MLIAVGDVCLSVCLETETERESPVTSSFMLSLGILSPSSLSLHLFISLPPPQSLQQAQAQGLPPAQTPAGEPRTWGRAWCLRPQHCPSAGRPCRAHERGPAELGKPPVWGWGVRALESSQQARCFKKEQITLESRPAWGSISFRVHCVLGGQSREEMKLPLCAWHSPPPGGPPQSSH